MSKHIEIYLLLILGLISCRIKEDMSDCPGTILLDYTSYTEEVLNEIKPDEQVNVYIFDTDGICCKIYTFTYAYLQEIGFEFDVPIQYNGLNAVVWHGNDSPDYSDRRMEIGESYNDFYLRLNYNIANARFTHLPASLWASPLEPIEYCASKRRHRIHMTRVHTRINVNLRQRLPNGSIKELDMDDYLITVLSPNDVYHTDYSISSESVNLLFTNEEELEQNTYLDWAHVGTLRVTPEMYCVLQMTPLDNPDSPILVKGSKQIDLVDYMLQSRDEVEESDEPYISDQRFLDLNKIWNIEFLLDPANIALSLTINGWTIWLDDIDLN